MALFRLSTLLPVALGCGLSAAALAGRAEASDYRRGPVGGHEAVKAGGPDWAGFYGGVHAGVTIGEADSGALASPLANQALPNSSMTDLLASTINFRRVNKTGSSYGAFMGINWLWDDVVLGFEADYTRSNIEANSSSGPYGLSRIQGTEQQIVNSTSTARAKISDWATLRGRVGWAAGYFMPFLTAGVAFGNMDTRASTSGTWERRDATVPPAPFPLLASGTLNGSVGRRGIAYGGAFGGGIDMQLIPNTFLRAELQHVFFASGGSRPSISINTARVAGGLKF